MCEHHQASSVGDGRAHCRTSMLRSLRPIDYDASNGIGGFDDSESFRNSNAGCTPMEPLFRPRNSRGINEGRSYCDSSSTHQCLSYGTMASDHRSLQPFEPWLIPECAIPPLLLPPPLHATELDTGEWLLSRQLDLPPGGLAQIVVEQPFIRPYRENIERSGVLDNRGDTLDMETWMDDNLLTRSWVGTELCRTRARVGEFEQLRKIRSTELLEAWERTTQLGIPTVDDQLPPTPSPKPVLEAAEVSSPPSHGILQGPGRIRSFIRKIWNLRLRVPRSWFGLSVSSSQSLERRHGDDSLASETTGR
ncbi:hypothetical protein BGZ63DRAFT_132232 [Mariannaea sp. PMI_226]|nr:hypothetical protein BGZ63DRAFT_132232 [Mariannaea sp. PMI_226]